MAAETIQDFLVSLGFKLDDSQKARFDAALKGNAASAAALDKTLAAVSKQLGVLGEQMIKVAGRPTQQAEDAADRISKRHALLQKEVKELGLTTVATAAAFTAGFTNIASQYERLYYVSQRTGLSPQQLAGLRFAGPQIGLGANDLPAAVEALATATRNPGLANLIQSWGVASNDLAGIVHHLAGLPTYLQDAYAGMLGISTTTMRNLIANYDQFKAAQEDFDRRVHDAGLNYNKTVSDGVQITRDLNQIWTELGIVGAQGFEEAYGPAHKLFGEIDLLVQKTAHWNKSKPGAALAETLAAAAVSALGLLGTLGLIKRLPIVSTLVRTVVNPATVVAGVVAGAAATTYGEFRPTPADSWVEDLLAKFGITGAKDIGLSGATPEQKRRLEESMKPRNEIGKGSQEHPHFADGGIVPVNAHAGEIILPQSLSGLLLQVATSGVSHGSGFLGGVSDTFRSWINGNTSYHPVVQVLGLDVDAMNRVNYGLAGGGGAGTPSPGGGAPSPGGGAAANIPVGSNEQMVRAAIAAAGGNEFAQAGLLANFYSESGLRLDNTAPGGDFGLAQWTGSRKKALFAYAAANNLSPYSAKAQTGYLKQELITNPQFRAMIQRMNASGGATKAAIISGFTFEQGGANASMFGGGRFSQAGMDAFHSHGAETIYRRITGAATRSPFPPGLVKYNSRGEPYAASIEHMTAQQRANVAAAHIPRAVPAWLATYEKTLLAAAPGSNVSVQHDAGDRTLSAPQTNHIHNYGADVANIVSALNTHARTWLRNAHAVIN